MAIIETMEPRRLGNAAVLTAAALLALSGCATLRRQEAADREQLLAAAGFQQRAANGPEQHQDLATMPPYKVVARSKAGQVVYTYADPERCHCLYVGGPKEFSEYRETGDASLNWETWGPWW